jgi:alkylation response protein AidB-like acyl-CoA dehydrogenase
MDIGFSEERELPRGTARRFLDSECDSRVVRKCMAEPAAVTDEFWQKLAAQGWLGIVYPEADGGSGLGLVDRRCRWPRPQPPTWRAGSPAPASSCMAASA